MTERFSFEVVDALDHDELRPGYPPEAVAWVTEKGGLGRDSLVVDLAAGTDLLSKRFGPLGMNLVAVEPAVLGALVPRACQEASQHTGNQGEEKQHPRMLRIGELEDESEFPTPTGRRTTGSYSNSKLFVTTLAMAVARRWADVFSNAVDPGWVPTKMGSPGASDDLRLGHLTQEWLATSDDPEARISGGYWYHQRRTDPHRIVNDQRFQDDLLEDLARFTGMRLT